MIRDGAVHFDVGSTTRQYMEMLSIEEYPFTEEELKLKFKALVRKYHSDTGSGDNKKTAQVIEAYKYLKNLTEENMGSFKEKNIDKKKDDIFDLSEECSRCKGGGSIIAKVYSGMEKCPSCTLGRKPLKCKFCEEGQFTLRSGRKVPCRACKGSGIWKYVTCRDCQGVGIRYSDKDQKRNCPDCGGAGRKEIKTFNPVIPKGAVLF